MRKLLIAISFFTRIPIKLSDVTNEEFYDSMILIPVVGLFIGLILYGVAIVLSLIHFISLQALLMVIAYIWLTGGLHLDGFADTTDALFSARDQKKMMEIMKDSRLGAFGAIGLILLILTNWMCYTIILPEHSAVLLVVPLFGRVAAIMSTCFSTYAPGGGGLGKRFVEMTKLHHFIIYIVLLFVFATIILGLPGLITAVICLLPALILMKNLQHKIGGMTGDTIGMTIELNQTFFMVVFSVILINFPIYFKLFKGLL
ncbi:adenosylcobinamide-GDP ribazoletransferase [Acetobacterium woodii]|uniref:Adenosylcobinamide-GDP ribazoletransferase n=1 Tax=Acetobacterium woodii (strain ATCC 29683 / DSM 1030 / JCM 2381 / KCTC 1655 / WB1) TaxID=931626 RepID=H6LJ99_ACEWD|nr:adenosylcobinamide-GDP ribazoletransferase [Acetobacterium woodii]AFA48662.1 cobalamin 5'-phosphate synthase CobS [Acetobacterium woodii DSM 1030]